MSRSVKSGAAVVCRSCQTLGVEIRTSLLVVLLLQCVFAFAGERDRPSGRYCNLSVPPETAGEEFNHGATLRIYPRAREIDSRFSGCQTRWASDGSQWILFAMVAIEYGDPVRIWTPNDSDPDRLGCIYRQGKVVQGDPQNCAAPQFLVAKSVAPGCVETIRRSLAEGGLSAPTPPGCEYE